MRRPALLGAATAARLRAAAVRADLVARGLLRPVAPAARSRPAPNRPAARILPGDALP